ncbi:hypothetical protein ACPW96_18065 [Micromonospora sp. DT81.3]|uniref:hypothetical protein n=1 Tax=Micromonospora sp. DT81.3 TaxID=3416523 RepID=UPI003CE86005
MSSAPDDHPAKVRRTFLMWIGGTVILGFAAIAVPVLAASDWKLPWAPRPGGPAHSFEVYGSASSDHALEANTTDEGPVTYTRKPGVSTVEVEIRWFARKVDDSPAEGLCDISVTVEAEGADENREPYSEMSSPWCSTADTFGEDEPNTDPIVIDLPAGHYFVSIRDEDLSVPAGVPDGQFVIE